MIGTTAHWATRALAVATRRVANPVVSQLSVFSTAGP